MTGLRLAADFGGTRSRLRAFRVDEGQVSVLADAVHDNDDHAGPLALLAGFLAGLPGRGEGLAAACVAFAGPVEAGRAVLTNRPDWGLDEAGLRAGLGAFRARLLNDFEAVAHGVASLPESARVVLQEGRPDAEAPVAVVGAGTGLGVAYLLPGGNGPRVLPTEGGHMDFGPADATQAALWDWLSRRHGHVSWERVVSGPGLAAIHDFMLAQGGAESATVARARAGGDLPAAVARAAGEGDALAGRALDLFLSCYGAFAGNVALATLPLGGLWIAGGIAPRLGRRMLDGRFMGAFLSKGRHDALLRRVPVFMATVDDVGLAGAAAVAARL